MFSKKEKAQTHTGYKNSVFSEDKSGCTAFGGNLQKKNSHGVWQKRYFYFNNEFLVYKKESSSPASDIKGVIDINGVATVNQVDKDIDITMTGGEIFSIRGSDTKDAKKWLSLINERISWLNEEKAIENQVKETLAQDPSIFSFSTVAEGPKLSGWLMKKSPHKFGGLQQRFVKIEDGMFHYFKHENDPLKSSLGSVSLETVDWVRPYDTSPDCKTFEFQSQERVFVFVAESPEDMHMWITAIDSSRMATQLKQEMQAAAKIVVQTPLRIRIFDDKGPYELAQQVRRDLDELYPEDCMLDLGDHIRFANEAIRYLSGVLPEVQKCVIGGKQMPARLDVLALVMVEINTFVTSRLIDVFDPSLLSNTLTLGDYHQIIDWLSRYQTKLSSIYCPQRSPTDPNPSYCKLFEFMPTLCDRYVNGYGALEGAAAHLIDHCHKVWRVLIDNPGEIIQQHQDGSFYTHAPIDTWEALNQHLSLASSTKSHILHVMIVEKIINAMNSVVDWITVFVLEEILDADAAVKEVELELLCALSNDLALHFENINVLIDNFEVEEIRIEVDSQLEKVFQNLVNCGQTCLRRISSIILEDVSESITEIFTSSWLGDLPTTVNPDESVECLVQSPSSQISVIIATISDYFKDLNEYLVSFWSERLIHCLLEELVSRYARAVMKVRKADVAPALPAGVERKARMDMKSMMDIGMTLKKSVIEKVAGTGLRANQITSDLIKKDVTVIVDFFKKKTSEKVVEDCIRILVDVSDMFVAEPDSFSRLLMMRINQCPPAGQAILETANKVAAIRDDLPREDFDEVFAPLEPMLKIREETGEDGELSAVDPDYRRICALYCDLGLTNKKQKLTRRLLDVAANPLNIMNKKKEEVAVEDTSKNLVGNVLGVIQTQNEEYFNQQAQEEAEELERVRQEQEAKAKEKSIFLEGYMDKKSPAHNLWQSRYFKFVTRVVENEDGKSYVYTMMWYKKKGGAVLKSVDVGTISGMQLLHSPRPLAYVPETCTVKLVQEASRENFQTIRECGNGSEGDQHYSFALLLEKESIKGGAAKRDSADADGEGKEVMLRLESVDVLLKWMNAVTVAATLEYDVNSGMWINNDRVLAGSTSGKGATKSLIKSSSLPVETDSLNSRKRRSIISSASMGYNSSMDYDNDSPDKSFGLGLMTSLISKKEKGQAHSGYRNSALSEDISGCPPLSGFLQKKNSHNVWQKRYFYLNNDYLIYKKDSFTPNSDLKGVIDIRDIATVTSLTKGDIDIKMKGGECISIKSNDWKESSKWVFGINQRIEWIDQEIMLEEQLQSVAAAVGFNGGAGVQPPVSLSGWLQKKSPHKYAGLQDRYVRIENHKLWYFKSETDPLKANLGSVSLEAVDWVRPFDNSDDCKTFEFQSQERVFVFVAESPEDMHMWITAIDSSRMATQLKQEMQAAAKIVAQQPLKIRIYDEKGPLALLELVESELAEIYPTNVGHDINTHLQYAAEILKYLDDFLPDIQKCIINNTSMPARPDVQGVVMCAINDVLTSRLQVVTNLPHEENNAVEDIYALLMWISHYQNKLRSIGCVGRGTRDESPTFFRMAEYIPALCDQYVNGPDGVGIQVTAYCQTLWKEFLKNPAALLETNADGNFHTNIATDLWATMNENLTLASSTKSSILHILVMEKIINAIAGNISQMTNFAKDIEYTSDSSTQEVEIEILCALSNDLSTHFEELNGLIDSIANEEVRMKVDSQLDGVFEKLLNCGQTCLRRIANLVMNDCAGPMQEIFSMPWLGEPPISSPTDEASKQIGLILNTVSEYVTDLKSYLVPSWKDRLCSCLLEELVSRYARTIVKVTKPEIAPSVVSHPEKRNTRMDIRSMMDLGKSVLDISKKARDKVVRSFQQIRANDVTASRIQADFLMVQTFFGQLTEPKAVLDIVQIINDITEMFVTDPDEFSRLLMSRINQCPPAGQAIMETANRVAAMRDDLPREEFDAVFEPLQPMLRVFEEVGEESELTAVEPPFRRICALYCDLGITQKKYSLTRRLLDVAANPLQAVTAKKKADPITTAVEDSNVKLLGSILEELQRSEKEISDEIPREVGGEGDEAEHADYLLHIEGKIDKKSPAHNLWQARWFSLDTDVTEDEDTKSKVYAYYFQWFKKKGGAPLKCIDTKSICGMQLLHSPRPLTYIPDNHTIYLSHEKEGLGHVVKEIGNVADGDTKSFCFALQIDKEKEGPKGQGKKEKEEGDGEGKEIVLRVESVDTLLRWMNIISESSKLVYDSSTGNWVRGQRKKIVIKTQLSMAAKSILKANSMPPAGVPSDASGSGSGSGSGGQAKPHEDSAKDDVFDEMFVPPQKELSPKEIILAAESAAISPVKSPKQLLIEESDTLNDSTTKISSENNHSTKEEEDQVEAELAEDYGEDRLTGEAEDDNDEAAESKPVGCTQCSIM